jgi:hypothetical protein
LSILEVLEPIHAFIGFHECHLQLRLELCSRTASSSCSIV